MATTRVYSSNAVRQRAYRQRREAGQTELEALVEAVVAAFDRGRSVRFVDNLPEEPRDAARELVARLNGVALVKFPPRKA